MRQLYAITRRDALDKLEFYSISQDTWTKEPTERDLVTQAWLDMSPVVRTGLLEMRANPRNWVHIYDCVNGRETVEKRRYPYSFLQWNEVFEGMYFKAYQSDTALKAAVKAAWDKTEAIGNVNMPMASVFKAFYRSEIQGYPDYMLERGPKGGVRKVTV